MKPATPFLNHEVTMKPHQQVCVGAIVLWMGLSGCAETVNGDPNRSIVVAGPAVLPNSVHSLNLWVQQDVAEFSVWSATTSAADPKDVPERVDGIYLDGSRLSRFVNSGVGDVRPGPRGSITSFPQAPRGGLPLYRRGVPLIGVVVAVQGQSRECRLVWSAEQVAGIASAAEASGHVMGQVYRGTDSMFGWLYTEAVRAEDRQWEMRVGLADGKWMPLTGKDVTWQQCGRGAVVTWHTNQVADLGSVIELVDGRTLEVLWLCRMFPVQESAGRGRGDGEAGIESSK